MAIAAIDSYGIIGPLGVGVDGYPA